MDASDIAHFCFFINLSGQQYLLSGTLATGRYFGHGEDPWVRDEPFLSASKKRVGSGERERCLPTRVNALPIAWASLMGDIHNFVREVYPQGIPKSFRALYGLYWHVALPLRYEEARLLLSSATSPIPVKEQSDVLPWISKQNKARLLGDKKVRLHGETRVKIEDELA